MASGLDKQKWGMWCHWRQGWLGACRFRRNFRGVPWVRSPVIHWASSSTRVLTMEYLPGIKISDVDALRAAGLNTEVVARRATEAYLMQVRRPGCRAPPRGWG